MNAVMNEQPPTQYGVGSVSVTSSAAPKQHRNADTAPTAGRDFALETGSPSNVAIDCITSEEPKAPAPTAKTLQPEQCGTGRTSDVAIDCITFEETKAPAPTAKTLQPEQCRAGRPKRSHAHVSYCEKRTKPRTARKLSDWFGFSGAVTVPILKNGDCFYSAIVKAFESIEIDVRDLLVQHGVHRAFVSQKSGCQVLRAICSDAVDDDVFLQFQACAHNVDFDFMKRFRIKNKGDLQRKMLDCGSDYASSQKGAEKSIWACEFEMGALSMLFTHS